MRFRDPVCGMEIRWEEAVDYEVVGPVVVYFCCAGCASRFREDPERHVDVRTWLGDEAVGGRERGCEGEPLDLSAAGETARKCRMLSSTPGIGGLTLDEVEALVARRWRHLLGHEDEGRLRARTLERALLSYGLARDPGRRHDIDRLLAAEVARLRSSRFDGDRIEWELAALPRAFAEVLLDRSVGPVETAAIYQIIEAKLAELRPWVFSQHEHHRGRHGERARVS